MNQPVYLRVQFILILVFILSAGIFQPVFGNLMQKTIINGVVTNFEDPYDLPALELINFLPFNGERDVISCFIEKDGVFRFEFDQLYPTGIMIRFKEMFIVYAHPGDSIYLSIDARMLSDTSKIQGAAAYNYIQIYSPKQSFQDEYQDFAVAFYSKFIIYDEYVSLREAQTKLDHLSYSEHIVNRSVKYNSFLNEFVLKNKPSNKLYEWADNWLYLKELDDLLRYAWLHPVYNKLDRKTFRLPLEYYDFLKDKRHNNEKLLTSSRYRSFLGELYFHLFMEFLQSELYTQFDSLNKAGAKTEAYRLKLKFIMDNSTGFEQQYFVSKFFSFMIFEKDLDEFETLYDPSYIGRDDYDRILTKEYSELKKLIEKPVFAKDMNLHHSGISEGELIFKSLPDKYPDKVIYVDFWAPWCGPCMAEMPRSKELQEEMKAKEVVFVFLANNCTEKLWKATIAQRQLSGEHYLLNDKEYSMLADKFNIAGIPRYMIIDKKGFIVVESAPSPSNLERVHLEINKYLQE